MENNNLLNAIAGFLLLVIVLLVTVSMWIITSTTAYDYLFYELDTLIDTQDAEGNLVNGSRAIADQAIAGFEDWIYIADDIWLLLYVVFSIQLFVLAYFAPRINYFSFFNIIYIGIMFLMIVLDIYVQVSNWVIQNILINILPTAAGIIPKFMFFLDNIGIIITIQIVICLLLNAFDFDISKIMNRKAKEQVAAEEIL